MAVRSRHAQPHALALLILRLEGDPDDRIAILRRMVAPQREVFVALVRPVTATDESWPIGWPWPGLPDRLERVLDAIENAREQMIGTFDVVTTRTTERTNDA